MAERVDRLERLINLLATLLNAERPLTRAELTEQVPGFPDDGEAQRRAFQRDLESLREMGIPVETIDPELGDTEQQYGYRVKRSAYELADPALTDDERAALQIALAAVRLDDGPAQAAVWKLGGADGRLRSEVDALPQASLATGDSLGLLFGAIVARRVVRFTYNGTEREVEPWQLSSSQGRWYLVGHDHRRAAARNFRIDRIDGAIATDGPPGAFVPPSRPGSGRPPPPWLFGDGEPVTGRLWVDASQAALAESQTGGPDAVEERRADGSVVLAFPVRNGDAFLSFAFGLLDRAEVLGPPELRDEARAWLERMAAAGATP